MSSLFQGLVDKNTGRVFTTTAAPGGTTVILRGIAVRDDGAVHVSTSASPDVSVGGVPVTDAGVVCISDTLATPEETLPGALRLVSQRLYTASVDTPEVIHQGVGLRNDGRMCREDIA